jgi:hypothetical protein
MSFGPRLRTRVSLRCDDDDECPEPKPSAGWGFLRYAVIACLPVALTAALELHIDRVKRERQRDDTEFDALLKRLEEDGFEDEEEDDEPESRH